jgi:hypothetical protein
MSPAAFPKISAFGKAGGTRVYRQEKNRRKTLLIRKIPMKPARFSLYFISGGILLFEKPPPFP